MINAFLTSIELWLKFKKRRNKYDKTKSELYYIVICNLYNAKIT